jgi:hypothetical protein
MDSEDNKVIIDSTETINVHRIVQLFANMMNYLNVSFYEGRFTYNHEQARMRLNNLYDSVSKSPSLAPSMEDIVDFYRNVNDLRNVTETDDPDYASYMRELYQHVRLSESRNLQTQRDDWTESIRMKKMGGI